MHASQSCQHNAEIFRAVADTVNTGIIVIDHDGCIWFWNQWMKERAFIGDTEAVGKPLTVLLPELENSRLEDAVLNALRLGQAALLSHALHKTPLPLFANLTAYKNGERIQQAIHVIPVKLSENGERFCIVQINDVTPAAVRERLLREHAARLQTHAYVDALSGIPNRRRFDEFYEDEFKRAARSGEPLSVLMIDIDAFKAYNDTLGHAQGDACLSQIANALQSSVHRTSDLIARYGGEEFIAVLPKTPLEGAIRVAENMRRKITGLGIPHPASPVAPQVTVSFGIASTQPNAQDDRNVLVTAADRALYHAKKGGRDCIACYTHDLHLGSRLPALKTYR
ncbi:MAG: diguanylate cyclase [Pseudomonadota bacterium]